ncbi:PREDICTED: transmembrane E3 ubiquitin-protein ligase 1 [Tarenaya hassleriana]|uniref:transmembrane E3 ubiquitin-protein ligase 1 n=1 Tax=Tarenaya hassleriana TaxID=28532 RepID=UPI00053C7FDE|nr:PREDICTED: transmembrane E3 ubiquitin-protein ligase 1 [Tarenaya hassleriana]
MGTWSCDLRKQQNLRVWGLGFVLRVLFGLSIWFAVSQPAAGLRPIRERARSWGDEWLFGRKEESEVGPFSAWNITGTYRGTWNFLDSANSSSRFPDFRKANGNSVIELVTTPTKITGVHYVRGVVVFHDVFDNEHNVGGAQIKVEGVYIWPFKQLRLVANSGKESDSGQEDDYLLSNPYHLLGIFSSQVFQESPKDRILKKKISPIYEMEKHCNIEIAAQISRAAPNENDADRDYYHIEGLMESPAVDDDGDCFSPLLLNATSVNIEVYYNKAVNYTLMVTFVSFLQVLLLIRQMEHSNTQSGAAKVSIVMIGQQAIMDAYLCLLHLTAGILVESLFNAFATAAFFKFVVFSIFEMRYLLAIWKASRPSNSGDGWGTMRRELSFLYSRFYGILLGGILIMYEFHSYMRPILLLMYSFWIPQIVANVIRDSRKPLHPYYIVGMTFTRLAIPLYVFGCPKNFMRVEPSNFWCVCLCLFMWFQASVLLLQHYFGSRCFVPRQMLPEKYSYYRRLDKDVNRTSDCVICMTAIELTHRSSDCMVTPCEHFFHTGCLQRWMDIKMECPTCRRPLPPA